VDQLRCALREEFVGMYRIAPGGESLWGKFLDEQKGSVALKNIEFPEVPPPGDFNTELVLQSEYFFC
jgi:DNA-directed RNA polymerase